MIPASVRTVLSICAGFGWRGVNSLHCSDCGGQGHFQLPVLCHLGKRLGWAGPEPGGQPRLANGMFIPYHVTPWWIYIDWGSWHALLLGGVCFECWFLLHPVLAFIYLVLSFSFYFYCFILIINVFLSQHMSFLTLPSWFSPPSCWWGREWAAVWGWVAG